ncbi:MAG: hypothetical protein ACFN40_02400 [Bacteroidota bacterium]
MKSLMDKNPDRILFCITEEELQFEAKQILGRKLNEEEIIIAQKGLDYGIMTSIDVVYRTILKEMIDQNNKFKINKHNII